MEPFDPATETAPVRPHMSIPPHPLKREKAEPPSRTALKLIGILVVLLVFVGGVAGWQAWRDNLPDYTSDGWHKNLYAGLDFAYESGRPSFVLFTADWCPPCRELKREVLSDPMLIDSLQARYILIKVDLSDPRGPNNRVARELGVSSIPTAIRFDPDGVEVERLTGGGRIAQWILGATG